MGKPTLLPLTQKKIPKLVLCLFKTMSRVKSVENVALWKH